MKNKLICLFLAVILLLGLCLPAAAAYTKMDFSDALVAYIKQGEGFSPQPFNDGTGWYIGYGCLIDPADYPNGITEPEAEALLRERMQSFADYVNNFCRKYDLSVTQGQFDAMCGMSYALGPAWLKAGNRLPDYLIAGIENYTDQQIASAFAAWCHVGGRVHPVALRRRIMEAKMFLDDDYSFTADGWNWLILDANGGSNQYSDVAVYRSGAPYGVLPEASRSGFWFAGWETESGAVLQPGDIVTANLNVRALWSTVPVEPPAPLPTETPDPEPTETPVPEPTDVPEPGTEGVFPDVPADAWFYDDVSALVSAGVVHGYDDGLFRPQDPVTWGQALKLLLLASGYPEQALEETEDDEPASHWASGYLRYAETKGFLAEGAVTDLDAPVTRNDLADLCAAALELTEAASPTPYADSSRDSVLKLYAAGIMQGSFEGEQRMFKGGDDITRAEICAVLVRVMDYVKENLILFAGYRIPVDHTLRPNPYDPDCFFVDNGRLYYDDGVTPVRCGIDVSEYQGEIDWAAVAADGIDFVMIRCGYRGYGKGGLNEDPYFRSNLAGAQANGLDAGVYFFSQALSVAEALEEAEYVLDLLADCTLSFPVAYDWEIVPHSGSRTRGYARRDVADFAVAFCEAVAAAGYRPLTYYNPSLAYLKLDLAKIQHYDGWLANYTERTEFRYDFQMWQYSSDGAVAGIKGRCDMNLCFTDLTV